MGATANHCTKMRSHTALATFALIFIISLLTFSPAKTGAVEVVDNLLYAGVFTLCVISFHASFKAMVYVLLVFRYLFKGTDQVEHSSTAQADGLNHPVKFDIPIKPATPRTNDTQVTSNCKEEIPQANKGLRSTARFARSLKLKHSQPPPAQDADAITRALLSSVSSISANISTNTSPPTSNYFLSPYYKRDTEVIAAAPKKKSSITQREQKPSNPVPIRDPARLARAREFREAWIREMEALEAQQAAELANSGSSKTGGSLADESTSSTSEDLDRSLPSDAESGYSSTSLRSSQGAALGEENQTEQVTLSGDPLKFGLRRAGTYNFGVSKREYNYEKLIKDFVICNGSESWASSLVEGLFDETTTMIAEDEIESPLFDSHLESPSSAASEPLSTSALEPGTSTSLDGETSANNLTDQGYLPSLGSSPLSSVFATSHTTPVSALVENFIGDKESVVTDGSTMKAEDDSKIHQTVQLPLEESHTSITSAPDPDSETLPVGSADKNDIMSTSSSAEPALVSGTSTASSAIDPTSPASNDVPTVSLAIELLEAADEYDDWGAHHPIPEEDIIMATQDEFIVGLSNASLGVNSGPAPALAEEPQVQQQLLMNPLPPASQPLLRFDLHAPQTDPVVSETDAHPDAGNRESHLDMNDHFMSEPSSELPPGINIPIVEAGNEPCVELALRPKDADGLCQEDDMEIEDEDIIMSGRVRDDDNDFVNPVTKEEEESMMNHPRCSSICDVDQFDAMSDISNLEEAPVDSTICEIDQFDAMSDISTPEETDLDFLEALEALTEDNNNPDQILVEGAINDAGAVATVNIDIDSLVINEVAISQMDLENFKSEVLKRQQLYESESAEFLYDMVQRTMQEFRIEDLIRDMASKDAMADLGMQLYHQMWYLRWAVTKWTLFPERRCSIENSIASSSKDVKAEDEMMVGEERKVVGLRKSRRHVVPPNQMSL